MHLLEEPNASLVSTAAASVVKVNNILGIVCVFYYHESASE